MSQQDMVIFEHHVQKIQDKQAFLPRIDVLSLISQVHILLSLMINFLGPSQ